MRFQVETATRVCTSLDDLGRELIRLRRLAAGAAASAGCLLVASGIAPYRTPGLAALTDQPRYQELARQFGPLVAGAGGACGCHVHVGVPSRDLGVQVLTRLRPWLAPLLAITVNSPIAAAATQPGPAAGTRPGPAGRPPRCPGCGRTPPPTMRRSAASSGAALRSIEQGIYFPARLSPRYPTVEVRVADVCLDAGTAVLLAGLTRALVATALAEALQDTPLPAAPASWVNAALAAAARHGLAGPAVDPFTGQTADARSAVSRLTDHVYPALSDHGDAQTITGLLRGSTSRGPGPTASERSSPAVPPRPGSSRRSLARRYLTACNGPWAWNSRTLPLCGPAPTAQAVSDSGTLVPL